MSLRLSHEDPLQPIGRLGSVEEAGGTFLVSAHVSAELYELFYRTSLFLPKLRPPTLREKVVGWQKIERPFLGWGDRRAVGWRLWLWGTEAELRRKLSWRRILHDLASPHGEWCEPD